MQYLRNLQSQLSHSLWIRSHSEPNKQRDFNDSSHISSSNISVISSLDPTTTTRFSTLTQQRGSKNTKDTQNNNNNFTTSSSSSSTSVIPHFVNLDVTQLKKATAATTATYHYYDDDIIAASVVASSLSSSSLSARNKSKSKSNNNNKNNKKKLSLSSSSSSTPTAAVTASSSEIKSVSGITSQNNNYKSTFSNTSNLLYNNNNSSQQHQHNRVCSSVTRREARDVDEQIIYSSFQQQSSKRRNSSFSSSLISTAPALEGEITGTSTQPVILSLTPLSKSVKKEYCKINNSFFDFPTNSTSVVLPATTSSSCSSCCVTTQETAQFSQSDELWNKCDNDKCLSDINRRVNNNYGKYSEKIVSTTGSYSFSSPTSTTSSKHCQPHHHHHHHHHLQADHAKQSSLLPVVDNPVLQLLACEGKVAGASSSTSNKEEKVATTKEKGNVEKSGRCINNSSSSSSGVYDDENVFVGAAEESNESSTSSRRRRSSTWSNSYKNNDDNSSNKNNSVFVVTSGTSPLFTEWSSSSSTRSGIKFKNEEERASAEKTSQEQQFSSFVDKKIDNNIVVGSASSSSSSSIKQSEPIVNRKISCTPTILTKDSLGASDSSCIYSAGSSAASLLFWGVEPTAGKVREKSKFEILTSGGSSSRQTQSCRERRTVSGYKEYGILECVDREHSSNSWSSSSKSILASEQDKDIQDKFTFSSNPPSNLSRSLAPSSSSTTEASAASSVVEHVAAPPAAEGSTFTDVVSVEAAAGRSRTSQDQSSPSSSSRFTTFTRDRSCSSTSRRHSNSSISSSNSTLYGSPVSSLSDLASVVLVTAASSREPQKEKEERSSFSAPVVVSPPPSTCSSLSSSSKSSTLLSSTSTTTLTNAVVLPLFKSSVVNSIVSGASGRNNNTGTLFVEGLSCSHKVNQRKKSINSKSSSSKSEIINSERARKRKRSSSIIQALLCTKGFNLFGSPKKLLSAIFHRGGKQQTSSSSKSRGKKNRISLSLSPSQNSSSLSSSSRNNNITNSTSSTYNNSRSSHRKFQRRARRQRSLLKLAAGTSGPTKAELLLWATMDHEDLIRELPQIEKLSNQERLRLAHKRRMLQLKKFQQYEKELNSNSKKHRGDSDLVRRNLPGKHNNNHHGGAVRKGSRRIRFRNSIMLLEAAGRNDVEEVRLLLESGVNPDVANEDGLTALHQCCIDDNEEMMKILLDYGANVNAEDSEKWTPLHAAATCGHLHLVQYLIARGANLLAVNAEGNMPYDICDDETTLDYIESEMAKRGVTQELIEEIRALPETKMLQEIQRVHAQGGDLEFRDVDGATPLHIASANGYYRVAEFLLDNHTATDVQDKDFWQPIHAAACWGHLDVLELLVQNGADLDARTKNNETPYAICEDPEIKERIIQLRSEQQSKRANEGRKRPSRTHSTNSRTQSIRRTSQRDKGLTSKRDAADEAIMLRAREELHKENSPSPTADVNGANKNASTNGTAPATTTATVVNGNGTAVNGVAHPLGGGDSQNNVQTNGNGNTSSEEDPEITIPPHVLGRDSIGIMQMKQDEMNRLRKIAVSSGAVNHNNQLNNQHHHHNITNNAASNGGIKMNNLLYNEQNGSLKKNQNNIHKNLNNGDGGSGSPVAVLSSPDDNGNLLPKPEINPSVDNKVPLGGGGGLGLASGMPLSGSRDNLVGVSSSAGNSTIDIHVSVTINTNSPVSTLTNGGGLGTPNNSSGVHGHSNGGPHSIPLSPGSSIFTPPGTLSDLKKQRSLIRTSSNPLTNGGMNDAMTKYHPPASPTMSLRRYVGDPAETVGDYGDGGKRCCVIV